MRDQNTGNRFYGDNFAYERQVREAEKYGRVPNPEAAAHPHVYTEHSIEPAYGNYDRPINEVV